MNGWLVTVLRAAATTPVVSLSDQIRNWISILASLGALGWIGRGLYVLSRDRQQNRVAKRKDSAAADSAIIEHWKEVAASADKRAMRSIEQERQRALDEREQKESAVRTVRGLLNLQETQNDSLQTTIARLTETIQALTQAAKAETQFRDELSFQIEALTAEKDELTLRLRHAQVEIAKLTTDLRNKQADLLVTPTIPDLASMQRLLEHVHTGEIETNGGM